MYFLVIFMIKLPYDGVGAVEDDEFRAPWATSTLHTPLYKISDNI